MKLSPKQRNALELIAASRYFPDFVREEDGWHARWQAIGETNAWVDEYVRAATMTPMTEDAEDQRHETLHDAWMMALRSRTGLVVWDDAECEAFARDVREWNGAAEEDAEARSSLIFAFSADTTPDGPFAVSCARPHGRRALRALGLATNVWGTLRAMTAAGDSLRVTLSQTEADDFLRRGAADLADAGYGIAGVDLARPITVHAETEGAATSAEDTKVKLVVRVAGEPVTAEDIRFLLEQGSSLVFFRNRWIEVDRNILKEALRALEKGVGKKANLLAFALGVGRIGNLEIEELKAHGWLRGLVNELRSAGAASGAPFAAAAAPPGLVGTLRDYQARGVAWLSFLTEHGFGALLADDMGLGKTIQVIAWLLATSASALIVAPLTLLANWRREFARFAPHLKIYVHQGDLRHQASGFRKAVAGADVVITSYTLLVKDYQNFAEMPWHAIVLDEAQAAKNPATQVARAIRALRPRRRVALTGTPVENSVADLWALEDFLNPGFLGDERSFRTRFAVPITRDPLSAAAGRLRRALEPFVLRRLKSDPAIAAELGAKREIREYCELSPRQRRAYEESLAAFRATEHAPGDVFALLTELKLICDGLEEMHIAGGKVERLVDLLGQIFDNGESALVFTQYAKVGAALQTALAERFRRRFPFLHGALSAKQREEQIRWFESGSEKSGRRRDEPMAFILSLKAGGFGLNLTKATHVIHFDRWWNPAAENQATDRAYRIGQSRDVFVHLMIGAGTLEEHVDDLLARKSLVAGTVITENEWLEAARLDE